MIARLLLCVAVPSALLVFFSASPALAQDAGAIGRIVPKQGVVSIAGAPGALVTAIAVNPGDVVKAGDVLINLQATAAESDAEIAMMEWQSAKTLAQSRVSAQDLAANLAEQKLKEATRERNAYRSLGPQGTTAQQRARLDAAVEEARVSLEIEKAKQRIVNTETQSVVRMAAKRLELAKTHSSIQAPTAGTVLSVSKRVGERLDGSPAVQMADLRSMYVLSQVYEGDLLKIEPGMKATIRNAILDEPLTGVVENVSRLVDTTSRLGEVRIKLDHAEPANRLVGMEVEVVIAR